MKMFGKAVCAEEFTNVSIKNLTSPVSNQRYFQMLHNQEKRLLTTGASSFKFLLPG